jgi:hypothetical protein
VVFILGLTVTEGSAFVNAVFVNQVKIPEPQVALKFELSPTQIEAGFASMFIGAVGLGVTETATDEEGLLQVPAKQAA